MTHARYAAAAFAISGGLARAKLVEDLLDVVASAVREATGAEGVGIVLASRHGQLWMAATQGLDPGYAEFQRTGLQQYGTGTRRAVDQHETVLVGDVATDPRYGPEWAAVRTLSLSKGFRSLVLVPMVVAGRAVGAINLYLARSRDWTTELGLLEALAAHAGAAIDAVTDAAAQRQQIEALQTYSLTLRQESHEYVNRLQALSGMLEADEDLAARRFLADLVSLHHANVATIVEQIRHPTLAGLLIVKMMLASEANVTLELGEDSGLSRLPANLTDAAAVTILGNLLDNAIDEAAAQIEPARRRVVVRVDQTLQELRIAVRDWGIGVDAEDEEALLAVGWTSKLGHHGLGLGLVAEEVLDANGHLTIERHDQGVTFTATVPYDDAYAAAAR